MTNLFPTRMKAHEICIWVIQCYVLLQKASKSVDTSDYELSISRGTDWSPAWLRKVTLVWCLTGLCIILPQQAHETATKQTVETSHCKKITLSSLWRQLQTTISTTHSLQFTHRNTCTKNKYETLHWKNSTWTSVQNIVHHLCASFMRLSILST